MALFLTLCKEFVVIVFEDNPSVYLDLFDSWVRVNSKIRFFFKL